MVFSHNKMHEKNYISKVITIFYYIFYDSNKKITGKPAKQKCSIEKENGARKNSCLKKQYFLHYECLEFCI